MANSYILFYRRNCVWRNLQKLLKHLVYNTLLKYIILFEYQPLNHHVRNTCVNIIRV